MDHMLKSIYIMVNKIESDKLIILVPDELDSLNAWQLKKPQHINVLLSANLSEN